MRQGIRSRARADGFRWILLAARSGLQVQRPWAGLSRMCQSTLNRPGTWQGYWLWQLLAPQYGFLRGRSTQRPGGSSQLKGFRNETGEVGCYGSYPRGRSCWGVIVTKIQRSLHEHLRPTLLYRLKPVLDLVRATKFNEDGIHPSLTLTQVPPVALVFPT